MKDVLSCGDLAKVLGLAPRAAQRLIDRGTIPGWRLPTQKRERRVDTRTFRAWLDDQPATMRQEVGKRLDRLESLM
jgi:hypothetical protein